MSPPVFVLAFTCSPSPLRLPPSPSPRREALAPESLIHTCLRYSNPAVKWDATYTVGKKVRLNLYRRIVSSFVGNARPDPVVCCTVRLRLMPEHFSGYFARKIGDHGH